MFYGDYASTLKATVVADPVTGNGLNVGIGDYVCTSGGNSGTHCGGGKNLKVRATGVSYDDGYGNTSMILADRVDGGVAAVRGDSGGPVYKNKTATNVYAVGMIQAGDNSTFCGPLRKSTSDCYSTVYYTSINTIIKGVSGSSLFVH